VPPYDSHRSGARYRAIVWVSVSFGPEQMRWVHGLPSGWMVYAGLFLPATPVWVRLPCLILLVEKELNTCCSRESNLLYGVCQVQSTTCCVRCANTPIYKVFEATNGERFRICCGFCEIIRLEAILRPSIGHLLRGYTLCNARVRRARWKKLGQRPAPMVLGSWFLIRSKAAYEIIYAFSSPSTDFSPILLQCDALNPILL